MVEEPLGPIYDGAPGELVDVTPCPIPRTWPTDRDGLTTAFDSSRNRLVMLPHDSSSFDVWDWDGRATSGVEAMSYDIAREVMVFVHGDGHVTERASR
jgi:hypothetical protein